MLKRLPYGYPSPEAIKEYCLSPRAKIFGEEVEKSRGEILSHFANL
jgi:hypothetical protein